MNKYTHYYKALSKINFIRIKMVSRSCRWRKDFYFKFGELLKNRIFFIHFWPKADSKKKISFQVRLSFILFMDFFFISRCHIFLAWSRRWKLITFTSQHMRYYGWYIAAYWFWFCRDNQFYDICSIFRRTDILDWRDATYCSRLLV